MARGAEGHQVFRYVLPVIGVVPDVVKFEVPGVRPVPLAMRPAALRAGMAVSA